MKKIVIFYIIVVIVIFSGCSNKTKSELTVEEVLGPETTIVWNPYWWYEPEPCSIPKFFDGYVSEPQITEYGFYYSYVDVDQNGERDLALISENCPIQFIVIKRDGTYYGIGLSVREGETFFTNGYILGDAGGGAETYYKIRVEGNKIVRDNIAMRTDDYPFKYFLNGKEVDEQEYETWIKENCKEEVIFEHYDMNN